MSEKLPERLAQADLAEQHRIQADLEAAQIALQRWHRKLAKDYSMKAGDKVLADGRIIRLQEGEAPPQPNGRVPVARPGRK